MKEYAQYSSPNDIRIHANSVPAFLMILECIESSLWYKENPILDPDNDTE